jgi:hypothetical protein
MNKYFVLGQQGTCLHFICCLIRLLYNKDHFNNRTVTNETGVYDKIFGAHAFYETLEDQDWRTRQYPESKMAGPALYQLKRTFLGKHVIKRDYYVEHNIIPVHYGYQNTINGILNMFADSKIVFIKFDDNDTTQIGLNYFNKVYMAGLLTHDFGGLIRLWYLYNKFPDSIIFDRQRFRNITQIEFIEFMKQVVDAEIYDKKFMLTPEANDNILVTNFGEMRDLDKLLNSLSEFTGQPITDNLRSFANNFLYNQPTLELSMNMIKQMDNNSQCDFMYNELINNFSTLTRQEVISIWKENASKQ